MANKLFVGSLAWGVDDNMLYQAFASFGQISEAKVMMERDDPGFLAGGDNSAISRGGRG